MERPTCPGAPAHVLLVTSPRGPTDALTYPADRSAALRFLRFVFEGVTGGYVEFRYFGPGRKPKVVDQSHYINLPLESETALDEVLRHNGRRMITFGPAPRCRVPGRGSRGKDHDVLASGCVWAALENRDAGGGVIEVVRRIRDFPLRPSVVVNSGYGYHVYFAFNSPLRSGRLTVWSDLTRDLREALGCDERIRLSQVMRLPGTLNVKEAHSVPCEIAEDYTSWTRYSTEEVRAAIEKSRGPAPTSDTPPGGGVAARDSAPSIDALRQRGVPQEIINAVTTGRNLFRPGSQFDGDSGRDFVIASTLYEKGFGPEEIKSVFRHHPRGCGSTWAQGGRGEKYLEATLRKVVERHADRRRLAAPTADAPDDGEYPAPRDLPAGYSRGPDGSIWFHPPVADEGRKAPKPVKVCNSPLRIAQIQEDIDAGQISLVIAFDYLGRTRLTPVLRSQASDARQVVAALAGEGAPVTSNNARLVTSYLATYEHAFSRDIPQKKVTSRFGSGRGGGPFFLPGLPSPVEFAPQGPGDASLYRAYSSRRGSMQGWLGAARAVADANLMTPQAAVLTALVPPLQRRLQIPNFILDVHGGTSTGKSISLRLAASVYGKPDDPDSLILQWMNTCAAVEQVAWVCGELPVFLDDAQHCPAEVKRSVVYMVANGRGKGRGAGGGGIRETPTWHTVALSTSEEPLHESSPHEGARGRILSVGGLTTPFPQGAAELVQSVERAVAANHGHAGEAYVRHLNGWSELVWWSWQRRYAALRGQLLAASGSNVAGRVSGYIAAVQLAGEVACPLLGLPFSPEVVGAWLMLHLQEQQGDQNLVLQALRALADYYVANKWRFAGDEQHPAEGRAALCGAVKPQQYVGFLRNTVEAVFRARRWGVTPVLNKLAATGALCATEEDRYTKKVTVGGVKHRMVCVKWSAVFDEAAHGERRV